MQTLIKTSEATTTTKENPPTDAITTETTTAIRGSKRPRRPLSAKAKTAKNSKNRKRRRILGIRSEQEIENSRFRKFKIYLSVEFSLVYNLDCILKYDLLNKIYKCNITFIINFIYRKRLEVAPYIERVIPILAHGAKPKFGP
jgi:hypothetical protein